MKKPAFCALLWILICCGACTMDNRDTVDELFQAYSGENQPGAAVMIIHDGKIPLERVYGTANIESGLPVTRESNFRLASITKQFTAMSILMLVEAELLTLQANPQAIFPDFPDYGRAITIEHLLQHTSGILAYESLMPDTATRQILDADILQMMMQQDSTYFPPGTAYRYSNTGYAVLAMIIEKTSGLSFPEYLKKKIFQPLKMTNSVAFQKGISEVSNRAFGYRVDGDSVALSDQSPTSAVLGDGGIYSSLADLYLWDQALYTEQLISREMLKRSFTPNLDIYGYGWRIDTYRNRLRVHHTGSTSGFRNVIMRFPNDKFTVIILTNRRDPAVAALAEKLTDLYLFSD